MAEQRGRICFVLGVPYSGSTALGNFLNGMAPKTYLGEVERLPQYIHGYLGDKDEPSCAMCEAAGEECSEWSQSRIDEMRHLNSVSLYESFIRRSTLGMVVDGSKSPRLLHEIRHELADAFEIRAIVLVRNPLLSMATYLRIRELQDNSCETWLAANIWRDVYMHAMSIIGHFEIPTIVFHSQHLRQDSAGGLEAATRSLRQFLDPRLDEELFDTSQDIQSFFQPTHQIEGNRAVLLGRMRTKSFQQTGRVGGAEAFIREHGADPLIDAFFSCPSASEMAAVLGVNLRECIDEARRIESTR